ncbi:MAG: hypothetical protein IPK71_04265 [Myxococcales bacterium]|nr:hypothetical protein [Myxococcales bacterium]MBL9108694.1 hypothetical protein [Myxococcales bacterium]
MLKDIRFSIALSIPLLVVVGCAAGPDPDGELEPAPTAPESSEAAQAAPEEVPVTTQQATSGTSTNRTNCLNACLGMWRDCRLRCSTFGKGWINSLCESGCESDSLSCQRTCNHNYPL